MRDEINLSYLGLVDRDVAVLRSMIKMMPQGAPRIVLKSPSEIDDCDMVIVNADSRIALSWWKASRSRNPLVVPIMVSKCDLPKCRIASIRRPMTIEGLVESISQVSATQTSEPLGDIGISDAIRILVVDDSFSVRQYMGHTIPKLLPGKVEISFAESGEIAMQSIWDRPHDIVFLDVIMPGIDGYKVCKAIKQEQFASVIMLTSKKSPFDRVRGTMSGCDAFMTKPPDIEELRLLLIKFSDKMSKALYEENSTSRAAG